MMNKEIDIFPGTKERVLGTGEDKMKEEFLSV